MTTEKWLISADALLRRIANYTGYVDFYKILDFIDEAPTVDAVEVVRCKDCKHYKPQKPYPTYKGSANYCCRCAYVKVSADDFCSYGERREGE